MDAEFWDTLQDNEECSSTPSHSRYNNSHEQHRKPPETNVDVWYSQEAQWDQRQELRKSAGAVQALEDTRPVATATVRNSHWAKLTGYWSDPGGSVLAFWFTLLIGTLLIFAFGAFIFLLLVGYQNGGVSPSNVYPPAPDPPAYEPPLWLTDAAACGVDAVACDVTGGQVCREGFCTCADSSLIYCSGAGGCVASLTQERCGACNVSCSADQSCVWNASLQLAQCVCPTGLLACGTLCVSPTSTSHCGFCFNACPPGFTCATAIIVAPDGSTFIGSNCLFVGGDTACGYDPGSGTQRNCTTLGTGWICGVDEFAPDGSGYACVDSRVNPRNCGWQGNPCAIGDACVDSVCQPSGDVNACGPSHINCFLALPGALAPDCCNGVCTDISRSLTYCGGCARTHACSGPDTTCVINSDPSYTEAGIAFPMPYRCSSPLTDRYACGYGTLQLSCAGIWGDGGRCVNGTCINTFTDVNACASQVNDVPVVCNTGAGELCCAGQCRATLSNPQACGGCGIVCPTATATCIQGVCVLNGLVPGGQCGETTCGPSFYCCGIGSSSQLYCAQLFGNDPTNCGGCSQSCTLPGFTCSAGVCINTMTDANNCGGVGPTYACFPGFSCCSGVCTDTVNSATYCGNCVGWAPTQIAGRHCCGGMLLNDDTVTSCNAALNPGCGQNCATQNMSCCILGTGLSATAYCASLGSDSFNCGGCGITCPLNKICCAGTCLDPRTDIGACGGCGFRCNGGTTYGSNLWAGCVHDTTFNKSYCVNFVQNPLHCDGPFNACAPGSMCVPTMIGGVTHGVCVPEYTTGPTSPQPTTADPRSFFVGLNVPTLLINESRLPSGWGAQLSIDRTACGQYNSWCMDVVNPNCVNGQCRCSVAGNAQGCPQGFGCVNIGPSLNVCQPVPGNCAATQFLCVDPSSAGGWSCAPNSTLAVPWPAPTGTKMPASDKHCGICGLQCNTGAGMTCATKLNPAGNAVQACICTRQSDCPLGYWCMSRNLSPLDPDVRSSCMPIQ